MLYHAERPERVFFIGNFLVAKIIAHYTCYLCLQYVIARHIMPKRSRYVLIFHIGLLCRFAPRNDGKYNACSTSLRGI